MLDVLPVERRGALARRPRKLETERQGIPLTYFSMPYFTIFLVSQLTIQAVMDKSLETETKKETRKVVT